MSPRERGALPILIGSLILFLAFAGDVLEVAPREEQNRAVRAIKPRHDATIATQTSTFPLAKNRTKGYNKAVVRLHVVWAVRVPAQAPEGLPPLRATALFDFVFSNDAFILLQLSAKCKKILYGFTRRRSCWWVLPYFSPASCSFVPGRLPAVKISPFT